MQDPLNPDLQEDGVCMVSPGSFSGTENAPPPAPFLGLAEHWHHLAGPGDPSQKYGFR